MNADYPIDLHVRFRRAYAALSGGSAKIRERTRGRWDRRLGRGVTPAGPNNGTKIDLGRTAELTSFLDRPRLRHPA